MKEQDIRENFKNNLIYYRKAAYKTQLDIANELNFTDKAVSKWERGESLPDVPTLVLLANSLGVTPNDLLSERIKTVKHPKDTKAKVIISLLSAGLVWLVATIVFVTLNIIFDEPTFKLWLVFIYAIPASAIVLLVLSAIWKNILFTCLNSSITLWGCAISAHLTIRSLTSLSGFYQVYYICIPVQILILLWFGLKYYRKMQTQKARKRFFENNAQKQESK